MAVADTAVVTGASSGIGEAIAAALLERGIPVVALQRSAPKLKHATCISARRPHRPRRRRARLPTTSPPNFRCAISSTMPAKTRPIRWKRRRSRNSITSPTITLGAAMVLIQSFVPGMRRAKFGRIVNISSRAILGKSERIVYASAKAGLEGMTRVVAIETGADGITVNAVMPGPVETAHFNRGHPDGSLKRQTVIDKVLVSASGHAAGRRSRGNVSACARKRLHHRAVALCLRRHQRHRHGRRMMARLKTALIGVGAWGKVLAKAASGSDKIEFVCCVGRNPERLSAFSRDTGIPARDFDAVLADKAIAAVVLALPNELHFEFARRAAPPASTSISRSRSPTPWATRSPSPRSKARMACASWSAIARACSAASAPSARQSTPASSANSARSRPIFPTTAACG